MSVKYWILGITLLVTLGACLFVFGPTSLVWGREIHNGDKLISKIESFHREHSRLPTSLSEVETNDATLEKFFYEKCNEGRFLVWFGTSLGESVTFDSASGVWKPVNVTCR